MSPLKQLTPNMIKTQQKQRNGGEMENMTDTQQSFYHPAFFLAEPTPDCGGLEGQLGKKPGSQTLIKGLREGPIVVVCVWGSGAKEVFLGKIFHPDKKINDLKKEPYPFGFWILLYERVMLIPTLVYAALKGR